MLPRPLIRPAELAPHIGDVRLIEACGATDAATLASRPTIVNAVRVGYSDLAARVDDAAFGGRHPLPPIEEFCKLVASWGIDATTSVAIVDSATLAMDAGARCYWMLRAIGLTDVRYVTTTMPELLAACGRNTALPPSASVATLTPAHWLMPIVDIEGIEAARQDPKRRIFDARTNPRYRGDVEPIDPVAGHIPGSRNAPFADDLETPTSMKSDEALRARYTELMKNISADNTIVYCGSGVTACQTLIAMEAAGFPNAILYVGSWSEWSRRLDKPIGRGDEI
ncbi:MAG: sulfurtransferase [Sandaracinaceae bacterium]|jgi:thiosulfate/3-mercaptopyruvate sulfurtransferase|nr:sulfurtransferase [Sandaracinaceae bacterium]